MTKRWRAVTYWILTSYERAFERFGFFLARKALLILVTSFIVVIVSGIGFVWLHVEEPSTNLFTAANSQSRRDFDHASELFPLLDARKEELIMQPHRNQNVLSRDCLNDAVLVHKAVVNLSDYKEICARNVKTTYQKHQDCVISSPLELSEDQFEDLEKLPPILMREWKKPSIILSTGKTFNSSHKSMLANFRSENKKGQLAAWADALRIIYFVRKPTTKEETEKVLNFEKSFESLISSLSQRLKCASISFRTGRAANDAIEDVLQPKLFPLYLSALIMAILLILVVYVFTTDLSCVAIVLLIFVSIPLPLACAAGILSMAGFSLLPTALFILFLLLGVGTSNLLFIVKEWERQRNVPSLEHRVSSCVTKAGFLVVSSSLCGSLLFGIAIKSSFEVVSNFFISALLVFMILFLAITTLAVVLLLSYERQLKIVNNFSLLCCHGRSFFAQIDETLEKVLISLKETLTQVLRVSTRIMTSPGGTIISLLIIVSIIALCTVFAVKRGERTGNVELLYQNKNYKIFREAHEKLFGRDIDASIVFPGKLNYSQVAVQKKITAICEGLGKASYSQGKPTCWISALKNWAHLQNVFCTGLEFNKCLKTFLTQKRNVPFRQDIRFDMDDSGYHISASRIHLSMAKSMRLQENSRSLHSLRTDLSEMPLQALPVSEEFFNLDDLALLENETIQVLVFANLAVLVFSFLSTTSFVTSSYLNIAFNLLVLEAACIMRAWNIHLNQISFLSLFTAIVVSQSYSIQVVQAFIISPKQEAKDRMLDSLGYVASSVTFSAFLSTAGSISLSFIFPSAKDIFVFLIPMIVLLGLLHALLIFPPVIIQTVEFLGRFGKPEHQVRSQEHIPSKSWTGDVRKYRSKRPGVSIVGISCKFPGASSKDKFWDMLVKGKCPIGEFPRNRVEEHKTFHELYHPKRFVSGRLCATNGSYLEAIQTFDNKFFGISNQEARAMDPQQKILLQVVYEAIEDSGTRLEDLQKCRTGVFVGVMNLEFGALVTDHSNYKNIDQFSSTGMTASILANRVSFCLDLTGPSVAVDTACSSSLTALKIALDNLHNGDCEVAIVCAPNIVLNHAMQMVSSMAGLLAPDGRCKSFDASGDGYGRGEGFAAVVLKLTKAALSDRDDIYCEIAACGMNNDGQNAVPMTAPSAAMQAELSRRVLEQSGMSPEDVDYFEAHGTGTAIGDVVETDSIADTYTRGTMQNRNLRVGSVKSNLNHTESTSGLAGLIKVALMIKHGTFVPTVNVHALNPKLKLGEKGIVVQQTCENWSTTEGRPRVGAVNSFGYGGSNVHAILCEVTSQQLSVTKEEPRRNHVLTISARSETALKEMAAIFSQWFKDHVEDTNITLTANVCYSLNERRSQFPHRVALSFGLSSGASQSLSAYVNESTGWDKLVSYGEAIAKDQKLVFMFGGQGSQWYAMGRQLIECEAVFRNAVWKVSNIISSLGKKWSLVDELMAPEDVSRIAENSIAQPATFAVQYATAQLLMSWGIYPSAVLGHSLGEFAAASIAGIITVKEAVQLVLTRSNLQEKCPNNGGMAALGMSEANARDLLNKLKLSNSLEIAAVNDAKSVAVSGDSDAIQALGEHLAVQAHQVFWRVLGTKRAFHSLHMELIRESFQVATKKLSLKPQLSKIPMYSTVTGEVIAGQQLNGDYWWRNIRRQVQFHSATKHLLEDGHKQIIEISTQPILAHYVKQIALQENLTEQERPIVLETLPRKRVPINDQHRCFLQNTACKLYSLGYPIDWNGLQGNPSASFVRLPTYPWQENSFWYRERPPQDIIQPLCTGSDPKEYQSSTHPLPTECQPVVDESHPFLAKVKKTSPFSGLHCWDTEIDLFRFPSLKDHALIQGGTVMPGAVYLEMALAMVKDEFAGMAGLHLTDVKLSSLLTLPETQVRTLRLRLLRADKANEAEFQITSIQDDQSELMLCNGSVIVDLLQRQEYPGSEASNPVGPAVNDLITNMDNVPMERFREVTERYGFNYGPNFSIIKQAWRRGNEGLCLVDISQLEEIQKESENYVIHPSILDACLQSCFVPLGANLTEDSSIVPVGFKTITVNGVPQDTQLFCHVTTKAFGVFDVILMSPAGDVLLTMSEFRTAELTSLSHQLSFSELAYEVRWKEDHLPRKRDVRPDLTCIILKGSFEFSDVVIERLRATKVRVVPIDPPKSGHFDSEAEKLITAAFTKAAGPNDSSTIKIINLWPVETTLLPDTFDVIEQAQSLAFNSSVFLTKLLIEQKYLEARLFLVTLCTQLVTSCDPSAGDNSMPWGSTIWGLRRTANLEEFNLRVTAVDLSDTRGLHEVSFLVDEVIGESNEDEVAFRGGKRFVNRIVRLQLSKEQCRVATHSKGEDNVDLCLASIPSSRQICLRQQKLSRLSRPELKINVLYSWTPSETLSDLTKTHRCVFVSGKVIELPEEGVQALKVGDAVCGVLPSGRVGRCVPLNISRCFVKPASLTHEQAACIPACLALAFHALQKVASDKECQRLLVHEANRGPGPAVVLLAAAMGLRVFCTISDKGSKFSKNLLLEMGAEGVTYQSCPDLEGDSVDGFDAALFFSQPSPNSFQRTIRALKKGGKLLILTSEIEGDIVLSANKHVNYEKEDIADTLLSPAVFERLSLQSLKLLESSGVLGKFLGLEVQSLDLLTTVRAVNQTIEDNSKRQLHSRPSNDISFTVHSFASFRPNTPHLKNIAVLPRGLDECGLKENGTYLVAGGIRGFGFEVARWMAENGAKTIGLLGRSKPSDATSQDVAEMEAKTGAKVHMFQVDISSQEQMASFAKQLESLPRVAGIVHTAMVLRDAFIKDFTFESFVEVMAPKIKGSFLLHQMSLNMDLDFFVMFSSMASIVGNMGQASYSAANAFQDALATYRRQVLDLPGLAINWGPISGAGVMERESGISKLLTTAGLGFIHAKEGVKHMAKVLAENPGRCQISLFDANWPRFLKSNTGLRRTPRLADISAEIEAAGGQANFSETLAQRIVLEKDAGKRAELVKEYVSVSVTEWTGISSLSETDLNKSLYSYGVDSTAALTLKMQLETNLQVSFEVFYFMQPDTTPLKMTNDVAVKLNGQRLVRPKLQNDESQLSDIPEDEARQTQPDSETTSPLTPSASQVQVIPLYTPAGSAIKFFCVHPSHRYAMSLVPISTGFKGQDLVSFYALGFTDPTAVSEDWGGVRQLATHYVQLVYKEQRHGPYFLGGYSYGGLLAYEMVSILTEHKQRVEFVGMIDTFPWSPPSRAISNRMTSPGEDENLQKRNVELRFENYLKKLAVDSLRMPADEFETLRKERNQDWIIDELQRRSLVQSVSSYDLRALRESLMMDHAVASRTHRQWQPSEIRYRGPLTFLQCENRRFAPTLRSKDNAEEVWGGLVDGGTTVLVCPGDHYSMSELPHAHVTGSILATSLLFSYRILIPDFPRPSRTFSQRRAVEKLCSGVNVFLHSVKGRERPYFGELCLEETKCRLVLRSKVVEEEYSKGKPRKIVNLKDLRMVQPGRFVSSSLKYAGRVQTVGCYQSGDLGQIASVVTRKRVYSFEFTDVSDMKAFYSMIEALFSMKITSVR